MWDKTKNAESRIAELEYENSALKLKLAQLHQERDAENNNRDTFNAVAKQEYAEQLHDRFLSVHPV